MPECQNHGRYKSNVDFIILGYPKTFISNAATVIDAANNYNISPLQNKSSSNPHIQTPVLKPIKLFCSNNLHVSKISWSV